MPSLRRIKLFSVFVIVIVVTTLFYTASLRQSRAADLRSASDFYAKTKFALDKNNDAHRTMAGAEDDGVADRKLTSTMQERLKEAAQVAKDRVKAKSLKPDPPSQLIGKGSAALGADRRGVAWRKKKKLGAEKAQVLISEETAEEHEAEMELNSILKKSPIIIFSKSYCPHSKRAKRILLEKYTISPSPMVVELDQHSLGQPLQAILAKLTGRNTVPNTLINAISIGGADDIADLDAQGKLVEKMLLLGARKIAVVERKIVPDTGVLRRVRRA